MVTEPKVNKLEVMLNEKVERYVRYLEEALIKRKESKEIINLLPKELWKWDWYCLEKRAENKWYLETIVLEREKADNLILELKLMGICGLKSQYKHFNNSWAYSGSMMLGDIEVEIKVDGGSLPPRCRIEEVSELKSVISYKAICEETGEEV